MQMFWLAAYVIGMLLTVRYVALSIQDDIDVENFEIAKKNPKGKRQKLASWGAAEAVFLVIAAGFWFVFAAIWAGKFLLFPRGFKSRFAREQEKLAKAREVEAKAAQAQEDLRRMQDEVLRYLPNEDAAHAMERLKRVVEGQRPSDEDPPIIWAA